MSTLHLIYIHGFQGNDASFQSFPTHLNQYLTANIPSNTINVRSTIYPTYKSVKSIASATRNLLAWLDTQPPGDVILVGHSMGGLLAAEAATSASSKRTDTTHRFAGVIAFDVPFLGLHPHVVLSGIISLFPDRDDTGKTEKEMNDRSQVHFVDQQVTEDSASRHSLSPPPSNHLARSPSPDLASKAHHFFERTMDFVHDVTDESKPMVKWMRKHKDNRFAAARRTITERLQFAGCMFDPKGLVARYKILTTWDGPWVNYWTSTLPNGKVITGDKAKQEEVLHEENDFALLQTGIVDTNATDEYISKPQMEREHKAKERARERNKKEDKTIPRHFVVLPTGLGSFLGGKEKWEKVYIGGVDDEVKAHTGIFKPDQNIEYDAFVERVGKKVLEFINHA